jgi:hypothetical protein
MVSTTLSQPATQMIINIDDRSIVNDIRRLLKRIQGVSSVRVRRNNYYESREFYQDLDAAEQDCRPRAMAAQVTIAVAMVATIL